MSHSTVIPPHPAQYSDIALKEIEGILATGTRRLRVLDPFAGVGGIHEVDHDTVGVEIEHEWAASHSDTLVGDATRLPFTASSFDAVVTSPCYGNRMADHHEAKDLSKRHTYRHYLGRPLSTNSAGALQWGEEYRALHRRAWAEARRVLRPTGLCLIVVSDHIRKGCRQRVVDWHLQALIEEGFFVESVLPIATRRNRHGANGNLRLPTERLLVVSR